jgi:hypothetical protein
MIHKESTTSFLMDARYKQGDKVVLKVPNEMGNMMVKESKRDENGDFTGIVLCMYWDKGVWHYHEFKQEELKFAWAS